MRKTKSNKLMEAYLLCQNCWYNLAVVISTIATEELKAIKFTINTVGHLLDYTTHPLNYELYLTSTVMLLILVHLRQKLCCWTFCHRVSSSRQNPIELNAIQVLTSVLRFVAASAAKAEIDNIFVNAKGIKIIHHLVEEMGHPQPPTPIPCNESMATGITNDTLKKPCLRSMEM